MTRSHWLALTKAFPGVPADMEFLDGDETDGPYVHGTSILTLSFSPDDSLIALAGGGTIHSADPTIRLIDPSTGKNVRTVSGHVCGIHDVSFDNQTGWLASASFDYSVILWNLDDDDAIFLVGADNKTKGHSKFTPERSLLAIGEYDYYAGPHSFYVYDLQNGCESFRHAMPNDQGVDAMAVSPDARHIALAVGSQSHSPSSRLLVFDARKCRFVLDRLTEGLSFYDLVYVGSGRILAGVSGGEFGHAEAGLILFNARSGSIEWKEHLGGIGVRLAVDASQSVVAVGFDSPEIRLYDTTVWRPVSSVKWKPADHLFRLCSLTFAHHSRRLAYGTSAGNFAIVPWDD